MSKKKGRTVNNIGELNLEIDYDKLAEAITRTQNRQTEKYSATQEWMKFILTPIFWTLVVFSLLLAFVFAIYGVKTLTDMLFTEFTWNVAITGLMMVFIGFFLATVGAFSWVSAKEIDEEKDRQYIASLFSNIVALVALVVSLVALIKG